MHRFDIVLVTPALADANNGNWQTAQRWARMLAGAYRVHVVASWDAHDGDESMMIALHARRSAASIARWRARRGAAPLLVALTGTDLYRDIADDASARASLDAADRLVVLNDLGARALPPALQPKARVVLQSCRARRPLDDKPAGLLRALMVGHLREVKSPGTYFGAARALCHRRDIAFDHVGAALEPGFAEAAQALMAECPGYRWLGGRPHADTRRRIQAAHVVVHPSRLEGGAHVVIEAVRSGTPVLASRIDGNVGLLGEGYEGYFEPGDAAALAALVERSRDDPSMLDRLRHQCEALAPRFDPARERSALRGLVAELLAVPSPAPPQRSAG